MGTDKAKIISLLDFNRDEFIRVINEIDSPVLKELAKELTISVSNNNTELTTNLLYFAVLILIDNIKEIKNGIKREPN